MEEQKFMYILEKGYWTMTDLKTKAMKAAYEEAKKHDRKIVYPDEIDDVVSEICKSVTIAANHSNGIKMPSIYMGESKKKIVMEGCVLIEAKKLLVKRCNPGF